MHSVLRYQPLRKAVLVRSHNNAARSRSAVARLISVVVVISVLAASLVTRLAAPAAAVSGFTPVFTTNAPGDITFLSNTLMTCNAATGTNAATCVSNGQNGTWANNNFTMTEVDVDADPSTSNSSSNDLTLAATANVLYAGLFWVGMASSANVFDPNIKLDTPATGGYTNLVASNIDNLGSRHYGAYVDVTSLVQAGGNGTYTIGGADLLSGASGRYGGWTLAIAYEDNTEPWRNLTVFNGYDFVYNGNTPTRYNVPLTVSGFTAPPVGPVNATIGVQTGEGDARYSGPTTEVNGTQISDAMNPANNVQNSTISILGTPANTLANPSFPNQLGFDADIIDATGLIPPNATSADLRFRSTGDVYGINLISTAIEIYVPNLTANMEKVGVDVNGEDPHPGDVIDYRVKFNNSGDDPATGVVITDLIPTGTTYVPNSLQIYQDVGATGPMTDGAGDDKAFFDAGTNSAVFHVGTGANATQGGEVTPLSQGGQTHEIGFQVTVDTGTEFTTVTNQARLDYIAKFLNEPYSATTNPVDHEILPLVDLTIEKSDDVDPVTAGNDVTYTVTVGNDGPSQADNVVITDALPAGVTFVSGAGCSASGTVLTCAGGNLAAGGTYTVDITVTVDGTFTGTSVTNLAKVASDTHEHDTSDNDTKEPTLVVRSADIKLTKSAPSTVSAGTDLTYTLSVENLGDSDALNVSLVDPLPAGVSFVSATADLGGTCDTAVSCLWPTLAAGASSTATVVVSVPGTTADGTVITNKAKASSTDPDPDESNNTDAVQTEVEKLADLETTKSGPATAVAGDQVTYTIGVANNGPSEAVNVEVTDPIPSAGFTFNPTASSSGCTENSGLLTCAGGTLVSGATASFTVVFDIDQSMADGTTITNVATSSTDTEDPNPANDVDSVDTEIVRQSDLFVQKDDNTEIATAGTQMTYTLTYGNNGDSDATGVTIVDTLPAGVSFNGGLSDPVCSASGATVTCVIGNVVAGANGSVEVTVDIDAALADGTVLSNEATISATEDDPNSLNNATEVDTPTTRAAELELTKTDDIDPVLAGEDISYTVTVVNIGPSTDTGIVLTDTLPAGVTFVSGPGCSESGGTVTCAIGTLAPTANRSFTITVATDADLSDGQILTNTASASGDISPPVNVSEQTTVNTQADLAITKTAPATVTAGTSMTYSIVVANVGPSNAANVSITDALPTGTAYSSHTVTTGSATCSTTASNITCSQATLAPGASIAVDVIVDVDESVGDGTPLSNTALVRSDTSDPVPGNDESTAPSTVEREADLAVAKTAVTPTAQAGQPASFQIVVTNNGPSQATNVILSDTLPAGFTFDPVASSSECGAGVSCTIPVALNTGDSYSFTVVADIETSVSDGIFTNSASASGAETDPEANNDTSTADVEVETQADLSIVKTSNDLTFTPGTTESYSVIVANAGPSDAQNVVVTDLLPTGLSFNAALSSAQCSLGVSCVLPTLGANQSITLTIAVDVDPAITTTITNKIRVASDTIDPDSSNDTDDDPTPVVPEADLAVAKSAAATVVAGNNLIYTINLTNSGPSYAHNVEIADLLPSDVTFVSASAGCTEAGGTVTCSETSVANGASIDYTITVSVPASVADGAILTNEVDVTTDSYDPDLSDNGDTAETEVIRSANVVLEKTVSSPSADAGTSVIYTITVTNAGPSNAADVAVADSLPPGMAATSATTTLGNCFSTGVGVACSYPDLAPGDTMTITVAADIGPSVADGTTLTNNASAATTTEETNPNDNADSASVSVTAAADLSIQKDSGVESVIAGETLTYTITATNAGPSDAQNVVVTDTVPTNLTVDSVTPAADCTVAGNTVTCTASSVGFGDDYVVTITATVNEDSIDGSTITNTASVDAETTDPDVDNNSDVDETFVDKSADLAIVKAATVGAIAAGETLYYNLEVSNLGPSSATNVVVTDTLPNGVLFNSTMSASNCVESAGVATCSFPTVAANTSITFVVAVDLPADFTDGETVTNAVSVAATEEDPDGDNNTDTDQVVAANQADLSIVKNAEGFAVAGQSVVWTLDIGNAGPSDAINVVITDTLPNGTTFDSAGSDSRCSAAGLIVTCTAATVGASTTDSFIIEVDVDSSVADLATLTNAATIDSDTNDPQPEDNVSSDDVPINRTSNLSIVKTDVSDPVVAGGQAQWSVAVTNNGPSDADNVTIVDTLPAGFSPVSVDNATSCSIAANVVSCSFPTVPNGSTETVVITADVDSDLPDGSIHTNTATADSDSSEPVSDSEDTAVQRQSDLGITKTSDGTAVAGTNQTYTITVTNNGLSDAANVTVTDALPAGITFVSDSLGACTAVGAVVTCSIQTMTNQAEVVLDLVVAVSDAATNPTVNAVAASSDSTDPNPDNNTATDSTDITYQADLTLSKSAMPSPATPGQDITWTLVVSNSGPSIANNVVVTDVLPTGATYQSASSGCSEISGTVTCVASAVPAGGQVSFTITAKLASSLTGTITNSASTVSDTPDPDPENNTSTDETSLSPSADLSMTKTANPDPVTAGEQLTYTLTVSNAGPSDASNISITDVVPSGLTVVEASLSPDCALSGQTVSCSTASLVAGSDYVLTIVADLDENAADGSTISNTASADSETEDPNADNNSATDETEVAKSADLAVTKTVGVDTIAAGQQLIYGVTVTNNGSSSATDLVVTDTLPPGVVYNAELSSATCGETAGVVTCLAPLLGADNMMVFNIVVDLPSSLPDGSTLLNEVSTSSNESDPDPANNSDTHSITLENLTDLSVVKDVDGFVVAGESISWDLTVANAGDSDAVNVSISDTLPAGTTFDPTNSDPRCSAIANVVTCALGTVAADSTDSVVVAVDASSSLPDFGSIENTATISSDTEDPDPENNSSTDSVPVQRESGLSIAKSDLSDPVVAGEQAQWSILVSNAGPSDASNVTITDTMPDGFTLVAVDDASSCTIVSNQLTCDYSVLANGDSIEVIVTADIDANLGDGSNHVNSATATSDSSEPVSDSEDTTVVRASDLSISKTSDNMVVAGTQHEYEISLTNNGPSDADNVTITDVLPPGVTYVSDDLGSSLGGTSPGGSCAPVIGTVVCNLITVPNQQTLTFTVVVAVDDAAGESAVNAITVDSDSQDPDPTNNSDTDTTSVSFNADVELKKSSDPNPAIPGQSITWTLEVTNNGPSMATNVIVADTLPAGTSFVSASVGCSEDTGEIVCANDVLAAGDSLTFEILADIDPGQVDPVVNTATAASDTPDSDPTNNVATSSTEVAPGADLSLTKSVLTKPVVAGQSALFELTVDNSGSSDATDVVVADQLPASLSFVWADDTCSLTLAPGDAEVVECSIATLAAGDSKTFQLEVAVDPTVLEGQVITNTASVTSATPDPDETTNEASVDVPVTQEAGLNVTKTVLTDDPVIGQEIQWLVEISNDGPSQATNIALIDEVNDAFTDVTVDGSDCSTDANTVRCERAALPSGSTWSTTISAVAATDSVGDHVNVAQITSDTTDFASASALFDVRAPQLDMSIEKTSATEVSTAGDTIEWLIQIENSGEATATPILISDPIPKTQELVSASSSTATCSATGNQVDCTVPAGFSGRADVVVTTKALTVGDEITNSATLTVENGPRSETREAVGAASINRGVNPIGALPFTGSESARFALFAAGLVLVGAILIQSGRRRSASLD